MKKKTSPKFDFLAKIAKIGAGTCVLKGALAHSFSFEVRSGFCVMLCQMFRGFLHDLKTAWRVHYLLKNSLP